MIRCYYLILLGIIGNGCKPKSVNVKTNRTIQLTELESVVKQLAIETITDFPNLYFDYAGMIPVEDENDRYDSSPMNTKVFGQTGGDGVHYSILEISEDVQPIVITVPMNFGDSMSDYNIILSENINEFLGIGYYNGWFPLEELCYNNNNAIEFYSKENKDIIYQENGDIQFVKKIREKFNSNHIPLTNKRLKELKLKYFDKLEFNQSFVDKYKIER